MAKPSGPTARVRERALTRLATRHPWIYKSDLERVEGASGGDVVTVRDSRARFLARALYSDRSEIALRVVSWDEVAVDAGFWTRAFDDALAFRTQVAPGAESLRLVHGEADGFPGLVVDRFADVVSIQTLTQGAERLKSFWVDLIQSRLHPRSIVERNDSRVRVLEGLSEITGVLAGEDPGEVEVQQGPVRLAVQPLEGQKTGAFLDQRENREAAARWASGSVLDVFSAEGGFAVRLAAVSSVSSVEAIESSAASIERGRANAARNGVTVQWREANAFDAIRELVVARRRYDTVVLDPPAFARTRRDLEGALRGYKEINLRGLKLLGPGGILVTCTCSHHVSESDFERIVAEAAADAGRDVTVLERRGAAADHRVRLSIPESAYLKCMILRVDRVSPPLVTSRSHEPRKPAAAARPARRHAPRPG
ncbi:MAG: class I SAM-dependent rRNA methyltransferase [Deltaproteobacteria bacterium]|nr:class I SAM-dependent rRNA methyltransferase [Deltaproteobacteria bacterium]